jgi:hypothetical protein
MIEKLIEIIELINELDEVEAEISRQILYNAFPEPFVEIKIDNVVIKCSKLACTVKDNVNNVDFLVFESGAVWVFDGSLSPASTGDIDTLTAILKRGEKVINDTIASLRERIKELKEYLAELVLLYS